MTSLEQPWRHILQLRLRVAYPGVCDRDNVQNREVVVHSSQHHPNFTFQWLMRKLCHQKAGAFLPALNLKLSPPKHVSSGGEMVEVEWEEYFWAGEDRMEVGQAWGRAWQTKELLLCPVPPSQVFSLDMAFLDLHQLFSQCRFKYSNPIGQARFYML